jgi:hypothetical protein
MNSPYQRIDRIGNTWPLGCHGGNRFLIIIMVTTCAHAIICGLGGHEEEIKWDVGG